MIAFLQSLPIGNAVRVLLSPPADAERWKVLRKQALPFTGHDDANAAVVYEGVEEFFFDTAQVKNGVLYHYAPFYLINGDWIAGEDESVTPDAISELIYPDPVALIRDRLAASLKVDVAAGRLVHENGAIPCLTAPPQYENTRFPIVTVQLKNSQDSVRGVGEIVAGDVLDDDGDWSSSEGWLNRIQIEAVIWVVGNPDTRIDLRRAVQKALLGNLAVFDRAGMSEFAFSQSDTEDFESYNSPMYQTITSITCLAPAVVTAVDPAIAEVTVHAIPYEEAP